MIIVTSPARQRERSPVAKYYDECVCVSCLCELSVCPRAYFISGTTRAIFTNFSVHVACGRDLVLLLQGNEIQMRSSFGVLFPIDNAL